MKNVKNRRIQIKVRVPERRVTPLGYVAGMDEQPFNSRSEIGGIGIPGRVSALEDQIGALGSAIEELQSVLQLVVASDQARLQPH